MIRINLFKSAIKKIFSLFLLIVLFVFTFTISSYKNISVIAADGPTIYLDLYKGNVTINANTYSGYNEYGVSVSGTHLEINNYYIFQSYPGWDYEVDGLPSYSRVTYGGKLWSTYITNNTDVNAVASNWASAAGNVGRVSTAYAISIKGNSTYNVIIDNLWSTLNNASTSRNTGGISFVPTKGGRAIIKIKGDTRFGNIHYNYNSGESTTDTTAIVFENGDLNEQPGSLTVISYDGKSNHYNSVIGGNDGGGGYSCGMIFNSGIIYAGGRVKDNYTGSYQIDNCSAIGGGGNDTGIIEINGATVTAVAHTTGVAIGGGIGESQSGGKGIVTITSGNVYAYNYGYVTFSGGVKYPVPAAAIGGASSRDKDGNTGKVTITGGNVYAVSVGGAAIGGGSSTKNNGGIAQISISGTANVTARSIAGEVNGVEVAAGASIGGGTGGPVGAGNGGRAELTISGGTIKTGSIGGGACNNNSGKIGHAIVNISGGVVQGQIVMAAGLNSACSFSMTGGVLDNSKKTEEFTFLHSNGGAVYMNDPDGIASISGGIIQSCSADNGGAIYMTDGTFELSGNGKINNCKATYNGGAVYLGGGTVDIKGGSITYCTSSNGGAIYMTAGDFLMSGESSIMNCSAEENGGAVYLGGGAIDIAGGTVKLCSANDGGAFYLTGGSVTMTGGSIAENTAQGNGGGINVSGGNIQMSGTSEIKKNTATLNGGGLYVADGNFLMISGLLEENHALEGSGGGAYISTHGLDVEAKIYSGIVRGNIAKISGGALAIVGTGTEVITVQVGVNDVHYDGEGNFIGCNHGKDYGLIVNDCPEIKENTASNSGGGIYIAGSLSTQLNIYCIIEENNEVDTDDESKSHFMMVEGGAVVISAASPENENDYSHGHNIINGSIHLTGGQMTISGSMNNPQLNGSITVDIVDGSSNFFEDTRPVDETYCKIQYFENFSGGATTVATGQYTIFQLKKGDSYTVQGSIYYREGYQISGWNTKKDGSGETYEVGVTYELTGDLILYAYWESHCYYIVYDSGATEGIVIDGTMERALVSYNQSYQLDEIAYIYKGYRFVHWKWNDKTFENQETVLNLSSEDGTIITLVAVWEKCDHIDTFVYTADGAILTKSCTCLGFDETITIKVPSDVVYDEEIHPASLSSKNEEWMSLYTIKYEKNGEEVEPINAGVYTASISQGDVTAYAVFEIKKAEQSAPEVPTYEVLENILTVSEIADSETTGAKVIYQLAYQTAEKWYYPDFEYTNQFYLELAYTNYNVFVAYEETENYKQSASTMAIKVYYFSGDVIIHIDNETGLLATASEDTENSRLIINVSPLEGYYLKNVDILTMDDSDPFDSEIVNNNLIYLTNIGTESTIKIKIIGAVIETTISSVISPNEIFGSVKDLQTQITNDSSFTIYFDVQNYVGYEKLRLNFNQELTASTSIIMIDKSDNSYWYIIIETETQDVFIEDFTRMGSDDTYVITSENFKLQFVVNLGDKLADVSNLTVKLNADVSEGYEETPDLVENMKEVELEESEFLFEEEAIIDASGLEKVFDIKIAESEFNSSEWDDRDAAIVISKIGETILPSDLKITVESTLPTTIRSATYSINENGEFIIPISKETSSIKFILSSSLFENESQDYKFEFSFYMAETIINGSPSNGDIIYTREVTFTSPEVVKIGAKIEGDKKIIALNGTLSLDVTINLATGYTYTMSLMYKSEIGEYVNTGWKFLQDNITINSVDPLEYSLDLSLAGQAHGSYCIMVIVKDPDNFTVINAPYYFIIK